MDKENKIEYKGPFLFPAVILSIAIIVLAGIGGWSVMKLQGLSNTISTSGSSKITVTSDYAKWKFDIQREVSEATLAKGYELLATDLLEVRKFLAEKNISAEEFEVSPVITHRQDSQGQLQNKYILSQTITTYSSNVDRITALADSIGVLSSSGIFISSDLPMYFYNNLPEIKKKLLISAIADARIRAKEISKANSIRIGGLMSASSGVVEVLAPNSTNLTDFDIYDTSSKIKDITVHVETIFRIK